MNSTNSAELNAIMKAQANTLRIAAKALYKHDDAPLGDRDTIRAVADWLRELADKHEAR